MSQVFKVEYSQAPILGSSNPASLTRFKKRSRMEIVANILDIAMAGALKTHLMKKANLSYTIVSQYLDFLSKSELIEETFDIQEMVRMYQTTPKGLKYLQTYDSLQSIAVINAQSGMHKNTSDIFS